MSEQSLALRVTWVKSAIGYADVQKRTIAALGLRRLHQTVVHQDCASVRGMIVAVRHLVQVEDVEAGLTPTARRPARGPRR